MSTTFSETDDDAAPMTTDGLLATRVWAEAELTDMSVESPESWMSWQAVMSVPAALISETARPTPEISGGTEEGQVAGQRQDAAHPQGVAAVLVALALVVGEGFWPGRSTRTPSALSRLRGRVGVRGRRRAAVVGSTGGKGQGQHGGAGHDLGPGHGVGTTHGWDLSFGCTDHRCHDPRVGQRGHRKPAMLRDCTPHPVVSEPLRQSSSRRARSGAPSTRLRTVFSADSRGLGTSRARTARVGRGRRPRGSESLSGC